MRLKQRRVRDNSCSGSAGLLHQYEHCYGRLAVKNADLEPYGPWYDPKRYRADGNSTRYPEVRVDLGSDSSYAVERLLELRRSEFTGLHTRYLSLNMLFYNNAFDLFCSARIVFVISPVGGMDVQEYYNTVPADTYKSTTDYFRVLIELGVFVLTMRRFYQEVMEIVQLAKGGRESLASYFKSFGNLVDWAMNICVLLSCVIWFRIYRNRLDGIDLVGDNMEAVEANDRLIELSSLWKGYSICNICVLFFALFTFFKIFHDHPQLGIVTATLAEGASELAYFGIVYVVVNLHYMFIGTILFGNELLEFSNLIEAWNTMFLIQIGAYEFASLVEVFDGSEDQDLIILALLYYYSFMVLVFFLLINILLGILIDAFVNVREQNSEAEKRIAINSGSFVDNIHEMVRADLLEMGYQARQLAWCLSYGYIARPPPLERLWSEEEWLERIDDVVRLKRNTNKLHVMKSSSMISLLAALSKLPSCKNTDIYHQACTCAGARTATRPATFTPSPLPSLVVSFPTRSFGRWSVHGARRSSVLLG